MTMTMTMWTTTVFLAAVAAVPQDVPRERPGRVAVDPSRTTQVYDVRDLLEPLAALKELEARKQELGELGYAGGLSTEDERKLAEARRQLEESARRPQSRAGETAKGVPTLDTVFRSERLLRAETQAFAAFAAKFVEPSLRRTQGGLEVAGPGTLTFTASPEQHAWLGAFLDRHRQAPGSVDVSTRFVRAPLGTFAAAGIVSGAVLEDPADVAALEATLGDARFEALVAPRVRASLLQRSGIRVEEPIPYIKDWEFTTVEPGHQRIADPQIDTVSEGIALTVRAALLEPGSYALSAEFEKSDVVLPIATKKVREPESGAELEIALPEVQRVRFAADLRLRTGAVAVLIQKVDDEREVAVVVAVADAPLEPAGEPVRRPLEQGKPRDR